MNFRNQLIKELKKYPDLYNEVRAEIDSINWTADDSLQQVSDQKLVNSIINNLNYYIEYEKEMGERDL